MAKTKDQFKLAKNKLMNANKWICNTLQCINDKRIEIAIDSIDSAITELRMAKQIEV